MVSAISGTGSSPLIPATDFSERALCKKWKLCSLPSVLRADCHSRALRAGYVGGWLAGCRETDLDVTFPGPQRPEKPAEKPLAFKGGVQATEGVLSGLAPGPGQGPTITPEPWEPHEASWEFQNPGKAGTFAWNTCLPSKSPTKEPDLFRPTISTFKRQ